MRTILKTLVLVLLLAGVSQAQLPQTPINATVTDPNGTPYAFGTGSPFKAADSVEKPIPSRVPCLTVNEEEFPMTMQVGMVGTDGVLIASDTRWMNTPRWANPGSPPRATFNSPKIIVNQARGIAISRARNMETAHHVANEIISGLKDEDWEYPILPIERIGARILPSTRKK